MSTLALNYDKYLIIMLHLLDLWYCYAQTLVNKKEDGNTSQRAYRAVILMTVPMGCFLTSTLLFALGITVDLQQVGFVPFLLLTGASFFVPYRYLNALFITKGRYVLASKLLKIKSFDKETFLLLYAAGFVYFVAVTYLAGHIR